MMLSSALVLLASATLGLSQSTTPSNTTVYHNASSVPATGGPTFDAGNSTAPFANSTQPANGTVITIIPMGPYGSNVTVTITNSTTSSSTSFNESLPSGGGDEIITEPEEINGVAGAEVSVVDVQMNVTHHYNLTNNVSVSLHYPSNYTNPMTQVNLTQPMFPGSASMNTSMTFNTSDPTFNVTYPNPPGHGGFVALNFTTSRDEGKALCESMGLSLANIKIDNILATAGEPGVFWINSWNTDSYGSACLALFTPGFAIVIPRGGCNATGVKTLCGPKEAGIR
ncbi:hypothetical protein YB2330_004627 [Saitoella coloradoensis]